MSWLLLTTGFLVGLSVGWSLWWFAPYLAARRRDGALHHRLMHVRPHPDGGTWPYYADRALRCACDAYPRREG